MTNPSRTAALSFTSSISLNLILGVALLVGCGSIDGGPIDSSSGAAGGSSASTGGSSSGPSTGGAPESGGASPTTNGGSPSEGGTTPATGSAVAVGGASTGGIVSGGAAVGGASTGGANATGGTRTTGGANASGGTSTGGTSTGGSATAGSSSGRQLFGQCRFHFGTIDSKARNNPALLAEIDMFTSGWIGSGENFNLGGVCTQTNPGQPFAGIVPALVSYIIAFTARRDAGLQDCNVGATATLCNGGATYIRAHLNDRIIPQYVKYAQGFASACGSRPMIWMMEPDYYQYTGSSDPNRLTAAEAGQIMHTLVSTVKQYQPSAIFAMDISPWIPNQGAAWIPNFTMSDFTFISTSGGGTDADNTRIRANNSMTWAGIHQMTGKPILADTGYGAAGASTGHDAIWDVPANINARIADGVISITQYNPVTAWGTTISGIRSQLDQVPCY